MFGLFKRKKKVQEVAAKERVKRDPNPVNTNRPSHFTESGYKRHIDDSWNDPLNPVLTTWAATTMMDDDSTRHTSSYSSCDTSSSYSSSDSSSSYSSSCDSSSSSSDSSSF